MVRSHCGRVDSGWPSDPWLSGTVALSPGGDDSPRHDQSPTAPPTGTPMSETAPLTDPNATTEDQREEESTGARDRLVILLLLVSTFVVILNETIMGVALPHLMNDLDISASAAQWLTTAFMLTMAVVIPITGFLLQRYNTRPVFIAAMTLFSSGTFIAAISPGFEVLLAAR